MNRAALLLGTSALWVPLAFVNDGLTVLVLPVALSSAGNEAPGTTVGLVSFAGLLGAALVQPFAGALSDRVHPVFGRRSFICGAGAALVAALAAFGVSGGLLGTAVAFLAVLVAASFVQAGLQPLVADKVPASFRGRAGGVKAALDVGGAFVAFLLIAQFGGAPAASATLIAVALVVALVLTVALTRRPASGGSVPRAQERSGVATDAQPYEQRRVLAALRVDVRRHPAFARLVLARFAFLLGTFAIGRFFVLLVADRLGTDVPSAAAVSGELLAVFTLATASAALPFGWAADRVGRTRVMAIGAVVSGLAVLALVWGTGMGSLVVAGLGMAVGSAAFVAANWAATTDVLPDAERGRFMGLANFGTAGAAASAGLLGPLIDLAPAGGDRFAILVVLAAGAMLAATVPLRGLRLPAPADARPGLDARAAVPAG